MKTHYPTLIHLGRFAGWSLGVLKRTFFGIGGIGLPAIAGLNITGASLHTPYSLILDP